MAMAAAELTGVRPDELEWGGGGGGRSAGAEWDEMEAGASNTGVEEDEPTD